MQGSVPQRGLSGAVNRRNRPQIVGKRPLAEDRGVWQRARMTVRTSLTLCAALSLGFSTIQAQNIISTSTDIFAPSFRGGMHSVYYGWSSNFDSDAAVESGEQFNAPNPPAPNLGSSPGGDPLVQTDAAGLAVSDPDIISATNNIYYGPGGGGTAYLTLTLHTDGTAGTGFTTIIIQGVSLQNAQAPNFAIPALGAINGVMPAFVFGLNRADPTNQELQWWAKYDITGNQASYDVRITLASGGPANPISINKLAVDTLWSGSAFAPDTAQAVPEPSVYALLGLGAAAALWRARRRVVVRSI